jgi:endonuclease III
MIRPLAHGPAHTPVAAVSRARVAARAEAPADIGALKRSRLYSEELGIGLGSGRESDYFLWFLASVLFGARISGTIARNTYRAFVRHGLTTPRKIVDAGWDFLVYPVMREGGYVRYDGRKSDQVLRDCRALLDDYDGRLLRLHERAEDAADLEARLLALYGVGPVTMNIFLRELRPFWRKADPEPLPQVIALAKTLGIELAAYRRKSLTFARIEAGLIRLSRRRANRPPGIG